ncbi:DUF2793 domain-containing protein [Novosphingobium sp. KCTC 2891]|uniref:DUF2793 domain-containing protein n=1 Tax=Novosphingobium sp. KCTC 2891 TaxID=2989730 RepID=UPI00222259A1|nr:DUF2793 domain-containing protein [Novosphingobium sp. KCTC 2891]MCW1383221.1 DUF2793 domain-containing protein [Novosphingobium sp. KCTC 2891]
MTDPVAFTSTTARHALPMLFVGQSQKETTVNEALLLADILLHPVVQGTSASAPAAPTVGACWIVATSAVGAFAGREDTIAAWSEGGWRFVAPHAGLRVHDASRGCQLTYAGSWQRSVAPPAPSGGTVVDAQARTAIGAILGLLQSSGIFSTS